MAVDASGTPSAKFLIPKYNTSGDAPSGKGLNNIIDSLDTILSNLGISSLVANDIPVYDSVAGKWKKATGTPSATTTLRGDGSWKTDPLVTTSTLAGGPPASPNDGDIWIATTVDANGTRWAFQFNAASASGFKWEFIGGPPVVSFVPGQETTASTTYVELTTPQRFTAVRPGDYIFKVGAQGFSTVSSTIQMTVYDITANASLSNDQFVTSAGTWVSLGYIERLQGSLTVGHVYGLKFLTSAGSTNFAERTFAVSPVRIA
jgi:hypothetical protein